MRGIIVAGLSLLVLLPAISTPLFLTCDPPTDPTDETRFPIPFWCEIVDGYDPFPVSEKPKEPSVAAPRSGTVSGAIGIAIDANFTPQPQRPLAPRRSAPSSPRRSERR